MLKNFDESNWIVLYISWELTLLKELGFDPFLEQFKPTEDLEKQHQTIEIDNIKYQVPTFLLSEKVKKCPHYLL